MMRYKYKNEGNLNLIILVLSKYIEIFNKKHK